MIESEIDLLEFESDVGPWHVGHMILRSIAKAHHINCLNRYNAGPMSQDQNV